MDKNKHKTVIIGLTETLNVSKCSELFYATKWRHLEAQSNTTLSQIYEFRFQCNYWWYKLCKTGVAAFLQFSKLVSLIEQIILHKKLHITWGPNCSMTK